MPPPPPPLPMYVTHRPLWVAFAPNVKIIHEIGITANDLDDICQGQRSLSAAHPLLIIGAKLGKNPSIIVHAEEQTRQGVPYFSSFIAK